MINTLTKQPIDQVIFALRREGLEVLDIQDGDYPRIVIQKPNAEVIEKAVEFSITERGVKRIEKVLFIGNCAVVWH